MTDTAKFVLNKTEKEYKEKDVRGMTEVSIKEATEEPSEPYISISHYNLKNKYSDSDGRVIGEDGGMKNDLGKTDWLILPFETIERVAKVQMYGEKKYKRDNWKSVDWQRNLNACLRHIIAHLKGETKDKDSGFHPLEHALCDLMFVVWKVLDSEK